MPNQSKAVALANVGIPRGSRRRRQGKVVAILQHDKPSPPRATGRPFRWAHSFVHAAGRSYHRPLAVARSQSATAGAIGLYWRPADCGRVAGHTTVAWCLAAVSLPVLAGTLFDITREYSTAVLIAAGANVAGMAMALIMLRRGWRERRRQCDQWRIGKRNPTFAEFWRFHRPSKRLFYPTVRAASLSTSATAAT